MNKNEFLRVADAIEYSDRFDLNVYAYNKDDINTSFDDAIVLYEVCTSVGCVCGWVNAINDHRSADDEKFARQKLDISSIESKRLFFAQADSIWSEVAEEYGWDTCLDGELVNWSGITAQQAAEVLRRIANGELTL